MDSLTQSERERITKYVMQAHNQVLQTVRRLSGAQLDFKEDATRWSIIDNVEHLAIVHSLVLSHVQQLSASPIRERPKQSQWRGRDDALLAEIRNRENRLNVPEIGCPKSQVTHEEMFRRFEAIRDHIVEFAETTNAPLRWFSFPHPLFGEKDCYQWLLGTGAHCERHLAQISEVIAADGFPQFAVINSIEHGQG